MSKVIAQRELRNQNAAIIAAVAAGQSFVVTRNGTPVAELRPIAPSRRTFVASAAIAEVAAGSPHIDAAGFEADLDRVIDRTL
jgi:prevent-host-death family protein